MINQKFKAKGMQAACYALMNHVHKLLTIILYKSALFLSAHNTNGKKSTLSTFKNRYNMLLEG